MIFVTVGTHEQQFNRLVEYIDNLKKDGKIQEKVFIQTGFSTYEPQHCAWSKMIPYAQMKQYCQDARIVITHGGPASFIEVLRLGKTPVVVPRQEKYAEHVNDHQVDFARQISSRMGTIIPVYQIDDLEQIIREYDQICLGRGTMASNNAKFNEDFAKIIDELL